MFTVEPLKKLHVKCITAKYCYEAYQGRYAEQHLVNLMFFFPLLGEQIPRYIQRTCTPYNVFTCTLKNLDDNNPCHPRLMAPIICGIISLVSFIKTKGKSNRCQNRLLVQFLHANLTIEFCYITDKTKYTFTFSLIKIKKK